MAIKAKASKKRFSTGPKVSADSTALKDRILDEMLEVDKRIAQMLQCASPKAPRRVTSSTAASLAALWEVSTLHQHHIERLLKMRLPRDIHAFWQLTIEIEVNWLSEAKGYLNELGKLLPRLRQHLERAERK